MERVPEQELGGHERVPLQGPGHAARGGAWLRAHVCSYVCIDVMSLTCLLLYFWLSEVVASLMKGS